ncbi:MAG TPA: hypothetical protein VLD67_19190, partial [Vicinamibacterales bacterium]|nr:hypothetical protein [Vicinamibacterales bacterium]
MLTPLIQLAIVAWLPGAVIFRLPLGDRSERARLDAGERIFWAVIISVAVSLSVVLALAAAGHYRFQRLLMADLLIAAAAAAGARFRLRLGPAAARPRFTLLIPIALVVVGTWRFFPPSEYLIGGRDPGVYMNEGIQIAQRGTLVYEDPVVGSVPPFARDLFFPSHQRTDYYGQRFMGFFIRDPDRGAVVGQFPHLFPASIAAAYGIDGLTGARRTAGFWAILGLLSVYFAGARLMGRMAALAAALLLSLHVVQVWFARYPNSEMVMQALLFAALLATARAHVDGDRFFAPLAGFLLGLMLFLRLDAALAVAGVLAGIGLLAASGGRWQPGFFLALLVPATFAVLYLAGPMRAYADRAIVFVTYLQWWQYLLIALGAAAAAALAAGSRARAVSSRVKSLAPAVLSAGFVAAAVYALAFRHPAGRLAPHDAYALRTFSDLYLTLPALIAALIGWVVLTRRSFWQAPAFFTTIAAFSLFFFYKIRVVPEHFWMARRFVPAILPGALLLVAAAALSGTRRGPGLITPLRWFIGVVFIAALASGYARASRPILDHVEYAGVIPVLERLAGGVADDDLLIVESRDAGTDVHTLATPLAYVYARNVLVLSSRLPDKSTFAAFLEWAGTRYARVLYLGAGGTDLISPLWGTRVLTGDRFRVPEFDTPRDRLPRFVRWKQFDYTVYEFTSADAGQGQEAFLLDVGTQDDLNVLRFHAKEESEGRTFRWSRDISYIIAPSVPAGSRTVTLWMSDGGRPDAAPPANVAVYFGETLLGTVRVDTGFKPYALDVPAEVAQAAAGPARPVQLKLTTEVWRPDE